MEATFGLITPIGGLRCFLCWTVSARLIVAAFLSLPMAFMAINPLHCSEKLTCASATTIPGTAGPNTFIPTNPLLNETNQPKRARGVDRRHGVQDRDRALDCRALAPVAEGVPQVDTHRSRLHLQGHRRHHRLENSGTCVGQSIEFSPARQAGRRAGRQVVHDFLAGRSQQIHANL